MLPRFSLRLFHHLKSCRREYPAQWRSFASPSRKQAAKPAEPHETSLRFAGRRPDGLGAFERKVAKEGNILLFKAPRHGGYRFGAYCLAGFCFAYAIYNSNTMIRDPITPAPRWLQACVGAGCILMSVMGTIALLRTARLIKTVNAFRSNNQTYLRFTVRSMIPFRSVRVDVQPRQIAVSRQLTVSPDTMTPIQSAEMEHTRPVSRFSLLKNPIKGVSIGFWHMFRALRQLFTQEDFIVLKLKGHMGDFRMDSNGFVSKDFLSITDLVSYTR